MATESTNSNQTVVERESNAQRSDAEHLEQVILAQPELITAAITDNLDAIREAAALVGAARRVRLAGAGYSASAAEAGGHLLRAVGIDARASHAFDLAVYPPGFDASDLLIAIASGDDRSYASRAVQRANHAGLSSIAVVTQLAPISNATITIQIGREEMTPTDLTRMPALIAALAAIAARFEPRAPLAELLPRLGELVRAILPSRDVALGVAGALADPERRVLLVAAGPAMSIARATALALAEVGGLLVMAQHVEDAILGGLRVLRPGDVVVQVAPAGPADARHRDLAQICSAVGIDRWRIGGPTDGARWHTDLPTGDETLLTVVAAIPLLWMVQSMLAGTDSDSTSS